MVNLKMQNGGKTWVWPIYGGRMGLINLAARRVQHVDVAYLYRQNGINGLALYFATPTTITANTLCNVNQSK